MTSTEAAAGQPPDLDTLLAQIDTGSAAKDAILAAVAELMREGRPVPLKMEEAALRIYIANDATRMDLKRRLATVVRLRGGQLEPELLAEVRDDLISSEHGTDFQGMLDEYSSKVRFADMEPEFLTQLHLVRRFTMTSIERLYALWSNVGYLCDSGVPGDVVECGVWRGGSMMLAAHELGRRGANQRDLWLFDTFAGLPRPDAEIDVDILGNRTIDGWEAHTLTDGTTYWAYATEEDVRRNLGTTGYPADRQRYVAGMVESTIPASAPKQIALLRIDTDWYASYCHILHHLYDRVVPGGVLIFDDYGHMLGAKRAVDEFRAARGIRQPLIRVDYSCRMMFKQ